jgi:hypothetical protein
MCCFLLRPVTFQKYYPLFGVSGASSRARQLDTFLVFSRERVIVGTLFETACGLVPALCKYGPHFRNLGNIVEKLRSLRACILQKPSAFWKKKHHFRKMKKISALWKIPLLLRKTCYN